MAASLFQRRIGAATDTHIAVARFEGADETGKLPPHISAVFNFCTAPHWLTCQGEQAALLPRG